MQTLQSLIPLAASLGLAALSSSAGAQAVDLSAASACLDRHNRLERLVCYDDAMGYMPDALGAARQEPRMTLPPRTRYGRFLDDLFVDQTPANRVRLTVIDPGTGATVAIAEEGSDAFAELLWSDPARNDIYLTIMGRETGANAGPARLVLACEEEITHMIVLWNGILRAGNAPARLYTDDRTVDPLDTSMRVVENGYATRAPRGLEAIALLRKLRPHDRLQISVDQDTRETRSALFDIAGLDRALRFLSRRCGWK